MLVLASRSGAVTLLADDRSAGLLEEDREARHLIEVLLPGHRSYAGEAAADHRVWERDSGVSQRRCERRRSKGADDQSCWPIVQILSDGGNL